MSNSRKQKATDAPPPVKKRQFYSNPNIILPLVAFIIRLIYVIQRQSSPFFAAPEIDQAMHDLWAQQIAAGDIWGREAFFRAPLYYYFLALIYYIFGHNYLVPRIVQITLGAYASWLTYRLGRRLYGEKAGLIAGFLYAFCGPIIYFEGELLIPAILLPLVLLFLNQLDIQRLHPSGKGFFTAGILLGLAAIARPNVLLFAPFALIWIVWILKGKIKWIVSFSLGSALIILPITLHNYLLSRDFVLIASQAGVNFYIGNNPYSNGYTAQVPGFPADWDGVEGSIRYAENQAGRSLKPSEVSRFWFERAFSEMSKRPLDWIRLTLHKIRLLYAGVEISNNEELYFQRRYSSVLAALMWYRIIAFPTGLLVPLGIMGLLLTWNLKRDFHLLFYFLSYSVSIFIFFVCTRYRLPLLPVLMIWTAAGLVAVQRLIREKNLKSRVLPLSLGAALLVAVNLNPLGEGKAALFEGTYYLGNKLFDRGDYRGAEKVYREALMLDSTSAPAHNGLGLALLRQGRTSEAKDEFRRATRYDPLLTSAHNNLAAILQQEGDFGGAEVQYSASLKVDSTDVFALRGLADIALAQEDFNRAEIYYRAAYENGAADAPTLTRWASALLRQGKIGEALKVNSVLLELQPNNARAHHNQARIYIACDSLEQAIRELETVLRLDPQNTKAEQQLDELRKQR